LDLSNNDFGDQAIDALGAFFLACAVRRVLLVHTKLTQYGFQRLLKLFTGPNMPRMPPVLEFSYLAADLSELATHQFFGDFAALLAANCPLEEIVIHGNVTAPDLTVLIEALVRNSNLKTLCVKNEVPQKYRGNSPMIHPEVQAAFARLVQALHRVLTTPDTQCALRKFAFPTLTAVFLFADEIAQIWSDVENALDANK
jgi:hypothetical protein